MRFVKMQGLGNDYIYVNAMEEKVEHPEELAIKLSNRHFGIGADGLILVDSSSKADVRMDMYNADGSRGMMCGNGIRCVAKYVHDLGIVKHKKIKIETLSGIKETIILHNKNLKELFPTENIEENEAVMVQVNMGVPKIQETGMEMDYISMGNPHAVVFMDGVKEMDLKEIGPAFESHERFPGRTNTEFVQVVDEGHVIMRVWERGSGETLACGTGACAVAVACALNGKTGSQVDVELLGGVLNIRWDWENDRVYMTGPAVEVYHGEIGLKENNV